MRACVYVCSAAANGDKMRFSGREKQKDVRASNIIAAKAVADCIRTSLGPKGMDKMITSSTGEVLITNDGATILRQMEVSHPAAKMLVDVSRAQDVEAGDGTTSVVVLAGALLTAAENLLEKGIHPSQISESWLLASNEAEKILKSIAIPTDLANRDSLIQSAVTSLNSKVVSDNSTQLAPLAVDAVLRVIDTNTATNVDLNLIRIVKKVGGTIEDTELVEGLVFDQVRTTLTNSNTQIRTRATETEKGMTRAFEFSQWTHAFDVFLLFCFCLSRVGCVFLFVSVCLCILRVCLILLVALL